MKNSEVIIGEKYVARVSGRLTVVEILDKGHPKGWIAKNLRTGREVYFKTGGRLWHPASENSMKTYLGFVPVEKFVIPDGPRCEGLDAIVEKLMAGATLPKPKPLSPKEEWVGRVKVVNPPISISFSTRDLAEIIIALTVGRNVQDLRDETGLDYNRCEEILEIRDKLIDLLK